MAAAVPSCVEVTSYAPFAALAAFTAEERSLCFLQLVRLQSIDTMHVACSTTSGM